MSGEVVCLPDHVDACEAALYRTAKTTDEKRSLLRMLSTMNSDAAIEAIDATLETKK